MCVVALTAACGGDPGQPGEEDDFKGCPPGLLAFGPGLSAAGMSHTLTLVSADPREPERYRNDWVVQLEPADTELERGQTFMPVHGHDGRVLPEITALQPGQFAVERLNFTMRGPWEVRLWLRDGDYVVFDVCVAR